MLNDDGTDKPSGSPSSGDDRAGGTLERRKRYPGILSKVASGSPEDTALALLKGELSLPVSSLGGRGSADAKSTETQVKGEENDEEYSPSAP